MLFVSSPQHSNRRAPTKSCARDLALCGAELEIRTQQGWQRAYLVGDSSALYPLLGPLTRPALFLAGPAFKDTLPGPTVSLVASDPSQRDRGRIGLHCLLSVADRGSTS